MCEVKGVMENKQKMENEMKKEIRMSNVEMNLIYKHSTKGETKLAFWDNEGLLQYFQEEAPFLENWLNSIKKTIKPEYATDVNSLIKKCQDVQNRQAQAMESYCK